MFRLINNNLTHCKNINFWKGMVTFFFSNLLFQFWCLRCLPWRVLKISQNFSISCHDISVIQSLITILCYVKARAMSLGFSFSQRVLLLIKDSFYLHIFESDLTVTSVVTALYLLLNILFSIKHPRCKHMTRTLFT